MIGEIRDLETAELAFRAAETGHLILSTLHTNDAIGAIGRLKGLGIDGNVCSSSLLGVLTQRLVRQVCWNCKIEYQPSAEQLASVFPIPPSGVRWYRGAGCVHCHHSGYKGRMVVAELWTPGPDEIMLINSGAAPDAIARAARKSTIPMAADAAAKIREGRTSLDELVRILPLATLHNLGLLLA